MAFLAALLIAGVTLLTGAEIISRQFFNSPITGALELSTYTLVYITFLASPWVLKREKHVIMEFVINRFSPGIQARVYFFTSVLGIMVFLIIAWYGADVTLDHLKRGVRTYSDLMTPTAPLLVIIPAGSLMLSLQFARRAYSFLKNRKA
jgi:TRAP-type C4-dicarboxylate transport system permease small subunit